MCHKRVWSLKELLCGFPCIIVAAGPSLSKNLVLLKESQQLFVIIAVDTIFQVLLRHGIEPDFILVIDPQHKSKRYFENIPPNRSILVFDSMVCHQILRNYSGKKVGIASNMHFSLWLEKVSCFKGGLNVGGSVSTVAYSLALKLGCDPIIFIGARLVLFKIEHAYGRDLLCTELVL